MFRLIHQFWGKGETIFPFYDIVLIQPGINFQSLP